MKKLFLKSILILFLFFQSFSSFGDVESWSPSESLYDDGQIKVEVQFKLYDDICTIQKPNKFRYIINGNSASSKTIYWELVFNECNGNLVKRQNEISINGGQTYTDDWVESMDYTFKGTFVSKQVLENVAPVFYELSGKVTDSNTGFGIASAKVELIGNDGTATVYSNSTGIYSAKLKAGNYSMTVSSSGYTEFKKSVSVFHASNENVALTKSLVNSTVTGYTLSGQVTDKVMGSGISAQIEIVGYKTFYTTSTGYYSIVLSPGSYSVKAHCNGYQSLVTTSLLDLNYSNKTQNFYMEKLSTYSNNNSSNNSYSNSSSNNSSNNNYSSKKRVSRPFTVGLSYKLATFSSQHGLDENQTLLSSYGDYLKYTQNSYFSYSIFYHHFGAYVSDLAKFNDTLQCNVGLYVTSGKAKRFYLKLGYVYSGFADKWFQSTNVGNNPYDLTDLPLYVGLSYIRNLQMYEVGYNAKTKSFDFHFGLLLAKAQRKPIPLYNSMKKWTEETIKHEALVYTFEQGAPLGISYVQLWGIEDQSYIKVARFYTDLRLNGPLFLGIVSPTDIDENNPNVNYDGGSNFSTIKVKEANFRYSMGVTVPMPYNFLPIWFYTGLGYAYHTQYEKMKYTEVFGSENEVWVHNKIESSNTVFPEAGIYVSMFNDAMILKLGSTFLLKDNRVQLGIGYNFNK